jgi:hypothetical protein
VPSKDVLRTSLVQVTATPQTALGECAEKEISFIADYLRRKKVGLTL